MGNVSGRSWLLAVVRLAIEHAHEPRRSVAFCSEIDCTRVYASAVHSSRVSSRRVLRSVANDINFRARENSRFVPLLSRSLVGFREEAEEDYSPPIARLTLAGLIFI